MQFDHRLTHTHTRTHTHTACSDDDCGYLYQLATAEYLRQTIAFQAAFSIQLRFVQTLMLRVCEQVM